jgi:hypothetical protein
VNGLLDELRNDRSGVGKGAGGLDVEDILSKLGEGKDFEGGEQNQFLDELLQEKDRGRGNGVELVEVKHPVAQNDSIKATATLEDVLHTVRTQLRGNQDAVNNSVGDRGGHS